MPDGGPGIALELRSGWSAGDVDRAYFVSLLLEDPTPSTPIDSDVDAVDTFWIDTLIPGHGALVVVGLSSTEAVWLEPGVTIGLQLGVTDLFTAWDSFDADGNLLDHGDAQHDAYARQLQLVVQPRARLLPWHRGPVLPFGLLGLDARFLGRQQVPTEDLQPKGVPIPDYDPRFLKHLPVTGVQLGAGVRFAVNPAIDLDLDGAVIPTLFGTRQEKDAFRPISKLPQLPDPAGFVFRATAGIRWHLGKPPDEIEPDHASRARSTPADR